MVVKILEIQEKQLTEEDLKYWDEQKTRKDRGIYSEIVDPIFRKDVKQIISELLNQGWKIRGWDFDSRKVAPPKDEEEMYKNARSITLEKKD